MKTIHKKRLLMVAKKLRRVPPKQFDYSVYVRDWKRKPDLSCGASACALGWATTIPALRKLGLRLSAVTDTFGNVTGIPQMLKSSPYRYVRDLFGINSYEYDHLFNPFVNGLSGNSGPIKVAKHIEKFVAKHGN